MRPSNIDVPMDLLSRFQDTGYIVLDNAIKQGLMHGCWDALHRLFLLDPDAKARYLAEHPLHGDIDLLKPGYHGFGRHSSYESDTENLLESWGFSEHRIHWPTFLHDEFSLLNSLIAQLISVSTTFVHALERYLSIDHNVLHDTIDLARDKMHLLHYPCIPDSSNTTKNRQGVHTDFSIFTVIPPPSADGLCVHFSGREISLHLQDTQALILAGRLLEFLTSGVVPSCAHSVALNRSGPTKERYSIPVFLMPRTEATLSSFYVGKSNTPHVLKRMPYRAELDAFTRHVFSL